jgi:hypothetical protein
MALDVHRCYFRSRIHSAHRPVLPRARTESGDRYGSGTLHSGQILGVGCPCFSPPLDVPTFSAKCLHVQRREGGTLRKRELFRQISSRIRIPHNSRDLLHAANLRHGTHGFTSFPKDRRAEEDRKSVV